MQKRFGDFFDRVELWTEEKNLEAQLFLESWTGLFDQMKWHDFRSQPLTRESFMAFCTEMAGYYRARINTISGTDQHARITKEGRNFLKFLAEIGREFGLDVTDEQVDVPLTPTEIVVAYGW